MIFRCKNTNCRLYPCLLQCKKAYSGNEYGDEYVEKPGFCPFADETDECAEFRLSGKAEHPSYRKYDETMQWVADNYCELPRKLTDSIDACAFYGERAKTDYRKVAQFCNLMKYENADEDRYSLSERVEELCKKFTKMEILIAALHNGYEMGLAEGARIVKEWDGEKNDDADEEEWK